MHLILMVMAIRLVGVRGSVGGEFVGVVFRCCGCGMLEVDGSASVASFNGVEDRRGTISPELLAGVAALVPQLPVLLYPPMFRLTCIFDFPFVATRSSDPCFSSRLYVLSTYRSPVISRVVVGPSGSRSVLGHLVHTRLFPLSRVSARIRSFWEFLLVLSV